MAPKHRAKSNDALEAGDDEGMQLRGLAADQKLCAARRPPCNQEVAPSRLYTSADGKDILKKSSSRKGRYLFHIAAQFQPLVGGRLGTLANLDSKNPVLYFNFPSGRLKLRGTLTFPKAKYLLLKFGTKDVLCEDVLDTVVLFADMAWVGTQEANPDECPLEMPQELQAEIERESAAETLKTPIGSQTKTKSPGRRKSSPTAEPGSEPASQARTTPRSASKRRKVIYHSSDAETSTDGGEFEEPDAPSQRQHLGRSAKAKRKLHERDSDAELDSSGADGSSGGGVSDGGTGNNAEASGSDNSPAPAGRQNRQAFPVQERGRKKKGSQAAVEEEEQIVISDSEVAGRGPPLPAQKKRRAAAAKSAARTKSAINSNNSDGDDEDEAEPSEDDDSDY